MTEAFLSDDDEISMGVTSGASTPNRAVQDSLERIFMLKKVRGGCDEEEEEGEEYAGEYEDGIMGGRDYVMAQGITSRCRASRSHYENNELALHFKQTRIRCSCTGNTSPSSFEIPFA